MAALPIGALLAFLAARAVTALLDCEGVEEAGIRWDIVREDLAHIVQQVLEGALSRDLQASKDSKGRDPAVSYGDVQLQRHLERFQRLAGLLPQRPRCALGGQCVRLLVSALYSGLPWPAWFDVHQEDLASIVHDSNWTEVAAAGWPLLDIISVLAMLHGGVDTSSDCSGEEWAGFAAVLDGPAHAWSEQASRLLNAAPCAFAQAVAIVAIAAAGLEVADRSTTRSRQLVEAQAAVRRAVGAGPGVSYALLLTPPLPALLSRFAVAQRRSSRSRDSHVNVVYCGELDIVDELREVCSSDGRACDLQASVAASPGEARKMCHKHYQQAIRAIGLRADAPAHGSTLLVSPFMWQWRPELQRDLQRLLREQAHWQKEVSLAGLPCINSSRIWNWPVRRLRHEFWKLAYNEYATGHETSPLMPLAQFWAVGDTTSSTRVYQTEVLLELMQLLARRELDYPPALPGGQGAPGLALGVAELFVELDLLAKERGLRAHTLLQGASLEDDYRARAVLSPRLSRTFHIEAARFLPTGEQQHHCNFPSSSAASSFTQRHGVVVSWCTRRALRDMFRDVGGWWLALSPRSHIIVPVSASVLNIFRSGETELFPWDADIDANFIASHPVVVGQILEENQARLAELGYTYKLRGDRVVFHDVADTARMDIWLSGPQDISAFNIRARLCGVRVNLYQEQLEGTVWYYRPGEKIYGNTKGKLLHCKWPGHNACLPDCLRNGLGIGPDGCEFADRFVHLDT